MGQLAIHLGRVAIVLQWNTSSWVVLLCFLFVIIEHKNCWIQFTFLFIPGGKVLSVKCWICGHTVTRRDWNWKGQVIQYIPSHALIACVVQTNQKIQDHHRLRDPDMFGERFWRFCRTNKSEDSRSSSATWSAWREISMDVPLYL